MIVDLFPLPIWVERLDMDLDVERMKQSVEGDLEQHALVSNGASTYNRLRSVLEEREPYHALGKRILRSVEHYLSRVGSASRVRYLQSWVNRVDGGRVERHRHQMSRVSGAYYLDLGRAWSTIEFYSTQTCLQQMDFVEASTQYNRPTESVRVERGTLVLFPGYLEHSVLDSDPTRWTVSFNTGFA